MYRVWFLSFVSNYLFVLYVCLFVRPLYSLSGSAILLVLIYIYVQKLHYEREQSINICRLLSPFFFMYVLLFKVAFMSDATLRRGSKSEVTWRYSSVHPLLRLPWHGSATTHVALLLLRYAQCDLSGPKYDMCLCFDSGSICVLVLRRCMAVCSWVCKCVKEAWVLNLFMSQWYDDQRLIPYHSGYILWRCM